VLTEIIRETEFNMEVLEEEQIKWIEKIKNSEETKEEE
jgi:hypothetical protein